MTQATLENKVTAAPGNQLAKTLTPLLLDAVVPIASYYLLSKGVGLSTMAALGWSSVIPAARAIWGFAKERRFNGLAVMVLATNLVGLVASLIAGDPRLMMAKDSAISSTVGLAILVSAFLSKPLMSTALKPWLVKGDAAKSAAWDRLTVSSTPFRRFERLFSGIWGTALLAECVTRVVCAYTLPIDTMAWFGTVILAAAFGVAIAFGGRAVQPMERLIEAEAARA
jgi:hypothetical protein